MRGAQIYTRGAAPTTRHLAEKMLYRKEYLALSKRVYNLNFLAPIVSETRGGPKFTLGHCTPTFSLAKIFVFEKCV